MAFIRLVGIQLVRNQALSPRTVVDNRDLVDIITHSWNDWRVNK